MNRRSFFKLSLGAGGALVLRWGIDDFPVAKAIQAQGTKLFEPLTIPKYVEPLTIPPVMAPKEPAVGTAKIARYEIAARQFEQQILPSGLPKTSVWGYGQAGDLLPGKGASSFNSPAFTVEARSNQRVPVLWVNHLVDNPDSSVPQFVPHLLPIDQTVHWANPPGPANMESKNPAPYGGPVPIVTHLHSAHTNPESDGHPEAWYLPLAINIPQGYALQGTRYASAEKSAQGSALFEYPNDVPAMTSWYHISLALKVGGAIGPAISSDRSANERFSPLPVGNSFTGIVPGSSEEW